MVIINFMMEVSKPLRERILLIIVIIVLVIRIVNSKESLRNLCINQQKIYLLDCETYNLNKYI